jgi:hypothetical protein
MRTWVKKRQVSSALTFPPVFDSQLVKGVLQPEHLQILTSLLLSISLASFPLKNSPPWPYSLTSRFRFVPACYTLLSVTVDLRSTILTCYGRKLYSAGTSVLHVAWIRNIFNRSRKSTLNQRSVHQASLLSPTPPGQGLTVVALILQGYVGATA